MAHSFIEFKGKSYIINDLDIIILVALIIDFVDNRNTKKVDNRIHDMLDYWRTLIEVSGPGCYDLKLDDYLNDNLSLAAFKQLVNDLARDLDRFGVAINGAHLNNLIDTDLYHYSDVSVIYVRQKIEALANLFNMP
jgi:hypothetical protein